MTRSLLAVSTAETFDRLALTAVAGALEVFGVTAGLALMTPDGQVRRTFITAAERTPRRRRGYAGLLDDLANLAIDDKPGTEAVVVPEDRWRALVPEPVFTGDVMLVVSRTKPDRPPVAVAVDGMLATDETAQHLLRQYTQSVALAVEALRSYGEQHLIALTLQRSFLPDSVPELPGVQVSVRYEPSSDHAEVGGDFYEVLAWRGKLLAAIGDVQGHSLHAATVMGGLRHALRAYADEGHTPVSMAIRLNSVLQRYTPDIVATLCLLLLDPASGESQIVNCGHIPPLIVDGEKAAYAPEGGVLLGAGIDEPNVENLILPSGGTVIMTTDGLVEDREIPLHLNLERLRVAAQEPDGDLEAFSDRLLALFGRREDDVALLILRRS